MAARQDVLIRVAGVTKSYGRHCVLREVSFRVHAGEVVALLGPNGAGKTTLVHVLATLTRPDTGTVSVAGFDVRRQARAVRRSIGVAGQFATVDEALSGRENLLMTARLAGLSRAARRDAVAREIQRFDLAGVINDRAASYSGGTRRRLDIAMSLVAEPQAVVLDEPSVGLDPRSRTDLWARIRSLATGGTSVLLTTQYLDEADMLADRIVLLDQGQVVTIGAPGDLKRTIADSRLTIRFVDGTTESSATDATLTSIRAALDRLTSDTRPVDGIEITPPSLDDVFLALTGGPRRAAEQKK